MANIGKYAIGIRLLLLKNYIETHAGVNRYVTRREMEQYLEEKGYPIEKKTLYRDLAALDTEFNVKLEYDNHKKSYRLLNPLFDIYELRLLVDCVQFSSFITEEEVATMVSKIKQLAVESDRVSLDRPVLVKDRFPRAKESFIRKIDTIHQAIAAKRQLSFCYHYYAPDRGNSVKTSNHIFIVNPRQLVLVGGIIYLATYDNGPVKYPGIEVAEMSKVKMLSTPCDTIPDPKTQEAIELFKQLDEEEIAAQKIVTIKFHNSATQTVLAIFGEDTLLIPCDDSHFIANIVGIDREDFYSRISFFGSRAKIIGPKNFLEGYENYIDDIADLYNKDIEPDYLQNTQPIQNSFNKFMQGE
ncbi:MAG: WYL domain-containing protein [Oscillospiraceae bacterium]|nr:WYL domain-containing protein [Oscillospiraceae bacterium]